MPVSVDRELFLGNFRNVVLSALDHDYIMVHEVMFGGSMVWVHGLIRETVMKIGNPIFDDEAMRDVKQEFYLIFLEAERSYDKRKPKATFQSYAARRVAWGMRDYLIRTSKIVTTYPYYYFTEEKPEFIIDLNFLLYGTGIYPLSELSPYERYLIFLRFREDKSILEISTIVQHNWLTVNTRLDAAIDKLRRLSDASKNTTGSSSTGSRIRTPGECSESGHPRDRNPTSTSDDRDS